MCPIAHVPCHPCAPSPLSPSTSTHYYDNVPHHICAHWPGALSPICPIILPLMLMCPLCSCAPLPMCPIAHVPYCSCSPLPCPHIDLEGDMPHYPYAPSPPFPWVMGHIGDGAAICQNFKWWKVVKKMSNVKKSNTWTMEEVHKKINKFT